MKYTIQTAKTVYDAPSAEDGRRILVMHIWPRGVKKERVDSWFKELGTQIDLIHAWKNQQLSWKEFRKRYLKSLIGKEDKLEELAQLALNGPISLLCSCKDEEHCHRIILRELLECGDHSRLPL
jgi:uncharacterized protein YeaO (DUF488 family)